MKKTLFLSLLVLLAACNNSTVDDDSSFTKLTVSDNGRFFMTEEGDPFFWLGDTGWLLFKNLTREEADEYLENRKAKGFNVIQVMVLHTLNIANIYGDSALINSNVTTPNVTEGSDPSDSVQYDYWDHVDYIVDLAAQKDIYMALVPVWGSNVTKGGVKSKEDAVVYGEWIAKRYKDRPNIIWVNGGDIIGSDSTATWRALGETLRATDPNHLITFHPRGRTSSTMWFHNEAWLDFNMFQSGHRSYEQGVSGEGQKEYSEDNWRYVEEDYAMTPAKPVFDGEPSYENIPHGLHGGPGTPTWKAPDVRRYAYWSVFAGGAGFTYGESSIMQMLIPKNDNANYNASLSWRVAMDAEGAGQVHHLKDLMLSKSYFDRIPDQSLVAGENGERYDYIVATRGADYALLYTYNGREFSVNMGKIAGEEVNASWFSPRDGLYTEISTFPNSGIVDFNPPGEKQDGNDWVLVLSSK